MSPSSTSTSRILHHLPLGKTTYHHAQRIQDHLVSQHLLYKRLPPSSPTTATSAPPPPPPPPPPTILTSEFHPPIYTTGRRHLHCLPPGINPTTLTAAPNPRTHERAEFLATLRGGQTTWHGPGQLTVYVVGDLASQLAPSDMTTTTTTTTTRTAASPPRPIGLKTWTRTLEAVTIATLERYGVKGYVDGEFPGVWLGPGRAPPEAEGGDGGVRKIAALGVHARRYVVAHGVGLNVDTDMWWWERIVPCGIVGRGVTSLRREMERREEGRGAGKVEVQVPTVEDVGRVWVGEMARALGREVRVVSEDEVMRGWDSGEGGGQR